jgi:hypothetical protein
MQAMLFIFTPGVQQHNDAIICSKLSSRHLVASRGYPHYQLGGITVAFWVNPNKVVD